MNDLDVKTNDIIQDWLEFREDEINSHPDSNDKKYYSSLEEISDNILSAVSDINSEYVRSQLEQLDNNYMDYMGVWCHKYYKSGFADGMKIVAGCYK